MKKHLHLAFPQASLSADFSYVDFPDGFLDSMTANANAAIASMKALEEGAIANPDEGRMVGHYWLRAPELAPSEDLASEIRDLQSKTKDIAGQIHSGQLKAPAGPFTDLLVIGMGRNLSVERLDIQQQTSSRAISSTTPILTA